MNWTGRQILINIIINYFSVKGNILIHCNIFTFKSVANTILLIRKVNVNKHTNLKETYHTYFLPPMCWGKWCLLPFALLDNQGCLSICPLHRNSHNYKASMLRGQDILGCYLESRVEDVSLFLLDLCFGVTLVHLKLKY